MEPGLGLDLEVEPLLHLVGHLDLVPVQQHLERLGVRVGVGLGLGLGSGLRVELEPRAAAWRHLEPAPGEAGQRHGQHLEEGPDLVQVCREHGGDLG